MTVKKEQDWLDIAEHYGIKQIPVAIEEMAELTQVLTKYLRIRQSGQPARKTMDEVKDSIEEELSDVIVMMIQLQYLFNVDNDTINKIADEKLKRTLELMEAQK
jgi:NTP pyrophosphatase (non-canonical NTP hydrolase)